MTENALSTLKANALQALRENATLSMIPSMRRNARLKARDFVLR